MKRVLHKAGQSPSVWLLLVLILVGSSALRSQTNDFPALEHLPEEDSLLALIDTAVSDSQKMEWYNQLRRLTIYENPERSLQYARRYGEYADLIGEFRRSAIARYFEGNSYIAMGDYENAMEAYLFADSVFTSMPDTLLMASTSNALGALYEKTGRDSLALSYFSRMLDLAMAKQDIFRIMIASNNMSNVYLRAGAFEKSMKILGDALKLDSGVFPPDQRQQIELNYTNILLKLRRYEEAEFNYRKYLSASSEMNNYNVFNAHKGLGILLLETGRHEAAVRELENAWESARDNAFKQEFPELLELLTTAYERAGRFRDAFFTLKNYTSVRDSLMNEEKDANLIDALTRYESEKKEQEIKLLSAQNTIKDLSLRQVNQQRLIMVLGLIGLAILAFLGFRLQYIKTRANDQLREKNKIIETALEEKNILMKEIHHRVKNNLQVISSLLKLQSNFITDRTALDALTDGRNRVQSMALLHQKLYRDEDMLGVDMKSYFRDLIHGLLDAYDVRDSRVELDLDIGDLSLDVDTVIPLGLIANELISNALKHAFADVNHPELKVCLKEEDDRLVLRVKDNGKGLTDAELMHNDQSFGHRLIGALGQKLNASIDFHSNGGLEVSVVIKDYQKTIAL